LSHAGASRPSFDRWGASDGCQMCRGPGAVVARNRRYRGPIDGAPILLLFHPMGANQDVAVNRTGCRIPTWSNRAQAFAVLATASLFGCSSTKASPADASPDGAQGVPCHRESDCGSGLVCGYKIADGCAAQGVCVPRWPLPGQTACGALESICSCEGVTVYTGCSYVGGYAPAPISYSLPCFPDASSADAGCAGWGASQGVLSCCSGLGNSPSGSSSLPGHCVPL